MRISMHCSL